jgi:hypothetical protein
VLRFFQTPLQYSFDSNSLREWYGFAIGAAFSGVVGVASILSWEIVYGVVLVVLWPQS